MDQTTLVAEQIEDARKLIDRLRDDDFPVKAAGWLQESGSGWWYLYLASPVVDEEGITKAYRRLVSVIQGMPAPFSIGPLEVKLVEADSHLVKDVTDLHRQHRGRSFIRHGGPRLGDVSINGAYIFGPIPATVA